MLSRVHQLEKYIGDCLPSLAKSTIVFACLLATLLLCFATEAEGGPTDQSSAAGYQVTIDPNAPHRTWDGWGISLCWWANVFGNRDDLADVCFTTHQVSVNGEALPGMALNIVRYNAGACSDRSVDGATMVWPPALSKSPLSRRIEGYWLDGVNADPSSNSWNWSADARQRAMLIKAKQRGANYFELFSNSPMWWMCKNHNPSGDEHGEDNLDPARYRDFANYLATIARHARDHWGISFTSVEPFNEPTGGEWKGDGRQEGCDISDSAQAELIPRLREALNRQGLEKTAIAASDECYFDRALVTWSTFSRHVKAEVAQVNTHCYQEDPSAPRARLHDATLGKRLWATEYGNNDPDGLKLARVLGLDLQLLRPTAWSYWQLCDNTGWALIPADLVNGVLFKANPKFFVFAQYTRHIRPGMSIFDSPDANTVAAYDPAHRKLILVTLNAGPARSAVYDLTGFTQVTGPVTRWLTVPKKHIGYQSSDASGALASKLLRFQLPADSVQTFEIGGTVPPR